MKFRRLRRDESLHWYLVPEDVVADFDRDALTIEEAEPDSDEESILHCDFDEAYGKYRLDGGPEDLRVVIEGSDS